MRNLLLAFLSAVVLSSCGSTPSVSDPLPPSPVVPTEPSAYGHTRSEWTAAWVSHLMETEPLDLPLIVRFEHLPDGLLGQMVPLPGRYLIQLNDDLNVLETYMVVQHEYAHALAFPEWLQCEHVDVHCDHWGVALSRVYRALLTHNPSWLQKEDTQEEDS